ncbi:MAG: hypothetical protein GX796_02755 [Clostridiaceae bacterium]|nr:hypothetical protein [Clostridiaceae bacterium]
MYHTLLRQALQGGRTPVAGIVHSVIVFLIMMVLMPFAKMIPLPTLATILMVVAYYIKSCYCLPRSKNSPMRF